MNEDLLDLTAMVLESSPVGEYDRRVVLLTRERGRISCFAPGARRQGSSIMAACLPFCFGNYKLRQGRSSNRLVEANIRTFFNKLREDMEATCYASMMKRHSFFWPTSPSKLWSRSGSPGVSYGRSLRFVHW